jgi:protein-tyrosine phosphatase
MGSMTTVLMVCSGNICRSPMAEVVLDQLARRAGLDLRVDSGGTGSWHVGEAMDPRSIAALAARGYDGTHHAARQITPAWLAQRDLVLAADRGHRRDLQRLASASSGPGVIHLLGEFSGDATHPDVPDPYYGGAADFVSCLDLVERSCEGLVAMLLDPTAQR